MSAAECKTGRGNAGKQKTSYVLIVDENASGRIYTSMLLQRFGYNCCTASSGNDAFEMAATVVPALIVIDQELWDMSSQELVLKLRRSRPTGSVPIIVKGARIGIEEKEKYINAGASVLEYPETAESLFRVVQRAIEATPRSNIRIHTRLPVVIDGRQLDCDQGECVSELSEYGMYVRTLHPCPPHEQVSVQLKIKGHVIEMKAQVLYCHHFGEGPFRDPGMGLKFTAVDSRDRDYLGTFISEEIMKGIPEKEES